MSTFILDANEISTIDEIVTAEVGEKPLLVNTKMERYTRGLAGDNRLLAPIKMARS